MTPEQARGQKVDQRADIFSVGTMLYEMLSGKRPFEGETMADVMAAVLVKDPAPLDQLAPDLSPTLKRIVNRCLEKEPSKRFRSASDLAFSLSEATQSKEATQNNSPQSKIGRLSFNSAALLAIVAVVSMALVFVVYNKNNSSGQTGQAQAPQQPKLARVPNPGARLTRLTWYDRNGNAIGTLGDPGGYSGPAFSPTGDRLVVSIQNPTTNRDLWIFNVASGEKVRLTNDAADELNPVWSPDGKWIVYTAETKGVRNVYRRLADGTGEREPLIESSTTNNVEDVSHDGRFLVVNTGNRDRVEPNLAMFSIDARTLKPFNPTKAREDSGRFSPNDRWLLYRSFETGQSEIFVREISSENRAVAKTWRVSTGKGGNTTPFWRGDGKEVFYLDQKTLMTVSVDINGSNVIVGEPVPLFNVEVEDGERKNRFAVTSDGQRLLVIVQEPVKN